MTLGQGHIWPYGQKLHNLIIYRHVIGMIHAKYCQGCFIPNINAFRPLVREIVGPFLSGFYFHAQSLQTMLQGCCISNISIFGMPVHENKICLHSPDVMVTPFPPLYLDLIFANLNPHSPKTAYYQICFKSAQRFWRVSILNVFPYKHM